MTIRAAMRLLAAATITATAASAATLPIHACVNIANDLESPVEAQWGKAVTDDDFRIIAAAGFDTVRLPVSWSTHAAAAAPYTIDPVFLARVTHVVDTALAAKLWIVVNDHNYSALFVDPAAERDRLAGIWRQIAAALAGRPRDGVWFEIENEPHGALTNANLMATLGPALAAIRATNHDRPVVIGGQKWSGVDSLATLDLPDDARIVPTFHYYLPFAFTHQGAKWVTPVEPLGATYGSDADRAALAADVAKVRAYAARTGRTPFMGEFGAYETVAEPQRVAYYTAVRTAFAAAGTGACAWAYSNTFPLHDPAKGWLPGMLGAMGLSR